MFKKAFWLYEHMIILEILFNWMLLSLLYALIGLPMSLLWGSTRVVNVAQGEVIMLGAYTAFSLLIFFGINPLYAFLVCAAWSSLLGFLLYKGAFSMFIFKHKETEKSSILFTFALSNIVINAGLLMWGAQLRGYKIMTEHIVLPGLVVSLNRIFVIIVCFAAIVTILILLHKTWFGKIVRASIDNRVEAQLCGINPDVVYLACTFISFLITSFSGILISTIYDISPNMGFFYTMIAFLVAMIGGLGNIKGCLVAGFIVGFVQTAVGYLMSGGVALTMVYFMFVIIICLRPEGIFNWAK